MLKGKTEPITHPHLLKETMHVKETSYIPQRAICTGIMNSPCSSNLHYICYLPPTIHTVEYTGYMLQIQYLSNNILKVMSEKNEIKVAPYLTVESLEPDMMIFSSYWRQRTEPVCPVNTCTQSNVFRSQICNKKYHKYMLHSWWHKKDKHLQWIKYQYSGSKLVPMLESQMLWVWKNIQV